MDMFSLSCILRKRKNRKLPIISWKTIRKKVLIGYVVSFGAIYHDCISRLDKGQNLLIMSKFLVL